MRKNITQLVRTECYCDLSKKQIQEDDIFLEAGPFLVSKEVVQQFPADMQQEKYVQQLLVPLMHRSITISDLFFGTWVFCEKSVIKLLDETETLEERLLRLAIAVDDPQFTIFQDGKFIKTVKVIIKKVAILEEVS